MDTSAPDTFGIKDSAGSSRPTYAIGYSWLTRFGFLWIGKQETDALSPDEKFKWKYFDAGEFFGFPTNPEKVILAQGIPKAGDRLGCN